MTSSTELQSAKPSRSYSKRSTALNVVAAWAAIAAAMWMGAAMAGIVVPIMVTLIAALLGIYQAVGHFDLRAIAQMTGGNRQRDQLRRRWSRKDEAEARTD